MPRRSPCHAFLLVVLCTLGAPARAQQVSDTTFVPAFTGAPWAPGAGPRMLLDEAHHNFHTATGRYAPFARLAARAGFRVGSGTVPLSDAALAGVRVLVIANALHERNDGGRWSLPTPSAFTADEIAAVVRFVERGGGLLLVADHMPFAGATEALGAAVGVEWLNGFAFDSAMGGLFTLRRGAQLRAHPVTDGARPGTRIDSLRIFTGSALRLRGDGEPVLTLPPGVTVWLPDSAWAFPPSTRRVDGAGWSMGIARRLGRGRVLALGEAAMLSAQVSGAAHRPMGFNDPAAPQNAQFVVNALAWLASAPGARAPR
ncbi:MAG: hypothetical protein HY275_11100 [Gemmatimonadetes bacterium]|nr:hypothetical protein [Gemmatimonadota bacterium]